MRASHFLYLLLVFCITINCKKGKPEIQTKTDEIVEKKATISGTWLRMTPNGPVQITFGDGVVESDLNNDKKIDVVTNYTLNTDTITFVDKKGLTCPEDGNYKVGLTDYYLSMDLIDDTCGGRVRSTIGFWVRPNFEQVLKSITQKINNTNNHQLFAERGRIYLALGNSKKAEEDFNAFIKKDSTNARVYMNRAATKFPMNLKGVVADCDKAIALNPTNKNSYFMRGIARYELGEKEGACEDFYKAIELGFDVLKEAEAYRCQEFWDAAMNMK